jgi:hypothetical protein
MLGGRDEGEDERVVLHARLQGHRAQVGLVELRRLVER